MDLGFNPEDVTVEEVELWPENAAACAVFLGVATQWRSGANGITGLDYGAVEREMRIQRVPVAQRHEVRVGVRTMERAVLEMKSQNG